MDDGYASWSAALVILGFVVEFIYHGYLAALEALNEASLEREASEEESEEAAGLLKLLAGKERVRAGRMMWDVILAMLWGRFAAGWIYRLLSAAEPERVWAAAGACAAAAVLIVLYVGAAHLFPEILAARSPKNWIRRLSGAVKLFSLPVWLPALAARGIALAAVKPFRIDVNAAEVVTEDEIASMVNEGHKQGVIEASEAEMINNIIEFGDKEAGDIMTHRKNIVAISRDMTLEKATDFLLEKGNSRVPVYRDNLDDVIGLLNLKDAVIASRDAALKEKKVGEITGLLRDIRFIPETRRISDLFRTMQSEKIHIVMVVDEYGQIDGLITMEDILEEIVGNILDEYDAEEKYVIRLENGYLLRGLTPLEEVEKALGIRLEDEEYETLNGLLISLLDRIPGENERPELDYCGYHFAVEKVENKMIHTVRATPLPKEEPVGA